MTNLIAELRKEIAFRRSVSAPSVVIGITSLERLIEYTEKLERKVAELEKEKV